MYPTLNPGTTLQKRYVIAEPLGKGGMGTVYKATDQRLAIPCAIKETYYTDKRALAQFEREAQILAKLKHAHLPRVSDYFAESNRYYLVMDFVPGLDADEWVEKNGPPLEVQVLEWAKELLDALNYLHTHQPPIIHRDIKPANVKIAPVATQRIGSTLAGKHQAFLVDFGIAKLSGNITMPGASAITPGYSPPEQYLPNIRTDGRSDIYSLGATLYFLLTGQEPLEATARMAGTTIPMPRRFRDVLPNTEAVVMRAMAIEKSQRWPDARTMLNALQQPGGNSTSTVPPSRKKKPALQILTVKRTDTGKKRQHNEDAILIHIPVDDAQLDKKGTLYIVADGTGGAGCGDVASRRATQVIQQAYYDSAHREPEQALREAFEKANQGIQKLAQSPPAHPGMGTTAVAAVIHNNNVHIANVGDSRAYLLRNGQLQQITKDHTAIQEQIDAGLLTPNQAGNHPQHNALTRALGHKPEIAVDTFQGSLKPGDILLLCSDGLNDMVRQEQIISILQQNSPPQAINHLVNAANAHGGMDNISVILIKATSHEEGMPEFAEIPPASTVDTPIPSVPTPAKSIPAKKGKANILVWIVAILALLLIVLAANSDIFNTPPTEPVSIPGNTSVPTEVLSGISETPTSSIGPTSTPAAQIPGATAEGNTVQDEAEGTEEQDGSSGCIPRMPTLVQPAPEATHYAWTDVIFKWQGGERCTANQVWQVVIGNQVSICPTTTDHQVTCQLRLDPQETPYQWRVELWENGYRVTGMATESRSMYVKTAPWSIENLENGE